MAVAPVLAGVVTAAPVEVVSAPVAATAAPVAVVVVASAGDPQVLISCSASPLVLGRSLR